MKLDNVRIKNFRCYKDEISIPFSDLTALVAKNDIGKSSVLGALDAFFNSEKLESGDRSTGLRNSDDVEITCIFKEIPEQLIIDTDNLISPASEYLLNPDGKLEIKKVFSGASPKCEQIFIRAVHPTAEYFGDLFSLTIAQLRARARELGVDLEGVNETIQDIFSCISLIPKKIIFIDSLEKLLESDPECAFKQLLALLKEHPDIKIIASSRKYAIDLITLKFGIDEKETR
jgi:hypothetical protein